MRKPVFDAIRDGLGRGLRQEEVIVIDDLLDGIGFPREVARKINTEALALLKESEGLRLTAYRDPVGIWTIGYGSTGPHVKPGMTITEMQAEALLLKDLSRFEIGVADMAKVATEEQFSAMVSLAFNIGLEALKRSTLLRKHNEGDYAGAKAEFARWNKAGGRALPGLTKRRSKEAAIYGGGA